MRQLISGENNNGAIMNTKEQKQLDSLYRNTKKVHVLAIFFGIVFPIVNFVTAPIFFLMWLSRNKFIMSIDSGDIKFGERSTAPGAPPALGDPENHVMLEYIRIHKLRLLSPTIIACIQVALVIITLAVRCRI